MERKRAIEILRKEYDPRGCDETLRKALETLIPELAESEDERIRKWIVNLLHELHYNQTAHPMALKAIEWLEKQKEQKPAEWSEEDEKMIERLITRLNWITNDTRTNDTSPNITFFEEIDWLKSLRPVKQEWDTHDKAIVNCIVCCLDGQFVPEAARKQALEWFNKHRRDFLNSPSWKPSEEQMEALEECGECKRCIKELYEQLNSRN